MERDEYDDTYSINHFLFIILDEWNVEYYKIMLTPKFYDPSMIETVYGMNENYNISKKYLSVLSKIHIL